MFQKTNHRKRADRTLFRWFVLSIFLLCKIDIFNPRVKFDMFTA